MEQLYMKRTHRITPQLIEKHRGFVWADVWHLADDFFSISLRASEKHFKDYWSNAPIKKLGYKDDLPEDEMISFCKQLLALGVPLDCFEMHGSTTWTSEKLREVIVNE